MAKVLARRSRAGWEETLLLPLGLEFEPDEDEDWDEEDEEDWDEEEWEEDDEWDDWDEEEWDEDVAKLFAHDIATLTE